MRLATSFSVPLPVPDAWTLLQDVERVARWFPGARLDSVEGERFKGTVRVKLGPMLVDYRGDARFVERDEDAHRVVIEASGREQRGSGTAKATAVTELRGGGGVTEVAVSIDLDVTGRPAQLGQSLMQDIAQRLVGEFSSRMEEDLSRLPAQEPVVESGPAAGTATPGDDVLDLGRLAGPAMARKSAAVVCALLAVLLIRRRCNKRC